MQFLLVNCSCETRGSLSPQKLPNLNGDQIQTPSSTVLFVLANENLAERRKVRNRHSRGSAHVNYSRSQAVGVIPHGWLAEGVTTVKLRVCNTKWSSGIYPLKRKCCNRTYPLEHKLWSLFVNHLCSKGYGLLQHLCSKGYAPLHHLCSKPLKSSPSQLVVCKVYCTLITTDGYCTDWGFWHKWKVKREIINLWEHFTTTV